MYKYSTMKKPLSLLIIFFSTFIFSQSLRNANLNSFKYFVVETTSKKSSKKTILKELKKRNFNVIDSEEKLPNDLIENPALALYITSFENCGWSSCEATVSLSTESGEVYWQSLTQSEWSIGSSLKRALAPLLSYKYNYDPSSINSEQNLVYESEDGINIKSEKSLREYFDKNGSELIEGIWEFSGNGNNYRLAIIKDGYKFKATVIDGIASWRAGETKATLETAASDQVLTINWTMGNKKTKLRTVGTVKNNALIEFSLQGNEAILYKVYPKFDNASKNIKSNNGEWIGNGSGIIISKSGYIITNNHVIEDSSEIEVEFIQDGNFNKFNAELVQVDKVNDLAILKIFDIIILKQDLLMLEQKYMLMDIQWLFQLWEKR